MITFFQDNALILHAIEIIGCISHHDFNRLASTQATGNISRMHPSVFKRDELLAE